MKTVGFYYFRNLKLLLPLLLAMMVLMQRLIICNNKPTRKQNKTSLPPHPIKLLDENNTKSSRYVGVLSFIENGKKYGWESSKQHKNTFNKRLESFVVQLDCSETKTQKKKDIFYIRKEEGKKLLIYLIPQRQHLLFWQQQKPETNLSQPNTQTNWLAGRHFNCKYIFVTFITKMPPK